AGRVFAEANITVPTAAVREAWESLSLIREKQETPQGDLAHMREAYARRKTAWNLADYTDLLEFWLQRIQTGLFSPPWTEILADEIQDFSTLQLSLVRALLPKDGKGFFGIGDPDQSIYAFRGACADARAFLQSAWPTMESMPLWENYRSRQDILHTASTLLGRKSACGPLVAAYRRLSEDAEGIPHIHLFEAPTAEAEIAWIAARVSALVGGGSLTLRDKVRKTDLFLPEAGTHSPGDIAVLVRMRVLAPALQKALARAGIPVAAPETDGFWADERAARILREAGRMLGICDSREEDKLPISDAVLARGPESIAAHFDRTECFDALFRSSSAFKALTRAYKEHGGWQEVINWVSLQTELELVKSKSERVQIMSLHAAKGLEFRSVFLPALEDGILPYAGSAALTCRTKNDPPNPDEERRLMYVGLTRARENLFLSFAGSRKIFGRETRLRPSRFLADLPTDTVRRSALVVGKKRAETHLPLF
ncbi:MAG: ATP-dependent helicase, partial [Desulfovibrio sp.]|nr:ATP-dependent helicase [Desulfovibrio sp.]